MATTTNYGWDTPDDTDLVKDGASAIRTLGSSVDTTVKNLNPETTLGDISYRSSTANTNTRLAIGTSGQGLQVVSGVPAWAASSTSTLTTTGDLLYASAANTLARRAIGSTGDVLTVSGGLPTWAAPAGGFNWSLLNSGGTALTGASSITVSGISNKNNVLVVFTQASFASGNKDIGFRINGNGSSNYRTPGISMTPASGPALSALNAGTTTRIQLGAIASNSTAYLSGFIFFSGCNNTGTKSFHGVGACNQDGSGGTSRILGGVWENTDSVSSIQIYNDSDATNFDAGTIYVYVS